MEEMETRVARLEEKQNATDVRLAVFNNTLENFCKAIEKFDTSVTKIDVNMEKFSDTMTSVQVSMEKMQGRMDMLASANEATNEKLDDVEKKIDTVQQKVEAVDNKGKVDVVSIWQSTTAKVIASIFGASALIGIGILIALEVIK